MRLEGPTGLILCALAGLALPLAFSPFDLFPVAPLSLAILFHVWCRVAPRRAFLCGYVYGLASFGFGVFWIHESFQFNHIALGWALFLTGLLIAFLALYPAIAGFAARRLLPRGPRLALLLVMPAAWVLAEWVRGWFFTGFTWLQLGYSLVGSPLEGVLPLGGVYLGTWAVAVSAGLLALAGRTRWIPAAALVVLWVAAGLAGAIRWTAPAGEPLAAALVQGNLPQDQKWRPENRRPTLERYLALTRENWDADIVVWPESALPGLRDTFDGYVAALAAEARDNDSHVVFGVPVLERDTLELYNSVFVVGGPDPGREQVYHKRHLVPFGEYLPLDGLIRPVTEVLGLPVADFSLGPSSQPAVAAGEHGLGISVCYEIAFGSEILDALPEAAILVTVSNDAWFGTSIGPWQHMQIARARALETGRYLLRATNTGVTAIVGPDGRMQAEAPQFETAVVRGTILPMAGMTPYARTGDLVVIVLTVVGLVVGGVAGRRRAAPGGDV